MKMDIRKKLLILKSVLLIAAVLGFISTFGIGLFSMYSVETEAEYIDKITFVRTEESGKEEFEDETLCPVTYVSNQTDAILSVIYPFEEWEILPEDHSVTGYVYRLPNGTEIAFDHQADRSDIVIAQRDLVAQSKTDLFGAGLALLLFAIGLGITVLFDKHFSPYEQIWFLTILAAAAMVSVLFPEEEVNGINGLVIMALYLLDTLLNILCELLISKQSKWNFIVSVFVELTEIGICLVLSYRFATLASTLFFWLPCDIISFINWNRHPDGAEKDVTVVRTLRGWQEAAIIAGIIVWTLGVGYLLTSIDIETTLFGGNRNLEVLVCYLDACASAVGVVNGIFILLRLREQWIAWYISALLEGAINVLSGQFVLLVLKVGYLTNTTYGYIRWSRYIADKNPEVSIAK